jgi:fructose/tagatose bisphosphate aldolase
MPLVSMKQMLQHALDEHYAVGHFNLNNLEFTQAILQAAEEERSPVILAVSPGYLSHLGGFARMKDIQKATGIPLVLHGGTGIPVPDIQTAISLGTAKINVNTENQMACTEAIRRALEDDPKLYDPRIYLGRAREAVRETVKRNMRAFGSSGKAECHKW